MNAITHPLNRQSRGPAVADLQDALWQCLERQVVVANDERTKRELLTSLLGERAHDVYGDTTQKLVGLFQDARRLHSTGDVDPPTASALNALLREWELLDQPAPALLVRGHVRLSDGQPFSKGVVQAFDKDLRREELLGETAVDGNGFYEIRYHTAQFRRAEKKAADLVVRVLNDAKRALVSSDVVFNAPAVQTIDLVVQASAQPSEFERYSDTIGPLLEELSPADLNDADVDFVARETGIAHVHVAYIVVAHQHGRATSIAPEVFYGLFRQNLPTTLAALLLRPPMVLRHALDLALQQQLIPARVRAELDGVLAALQRQFEEQVLRHGTGGDTVPRLLRAAGLTTTEQAQFLTGYLSHQGSSEEFWRGLRASPLAPKIASVQATLQLGLLTRNNLPLLEALQVKNVRSVGDLVQMSRQELQRVVLDSKDIVAAIPSDAPEEPTEQKAQRYVDGMFDILHATMPTAFLHAAYARSQDPVRQNVARVLTNAPDLELRDAHLDRFLADHPRALEGISNPDDVKRQLKRVQRVLRVAPHAEHAEILLSAGLDSAQAIAGMAPAAFEAQFAESFGGPLQAKAYHYHAQQAVATATAIIAALKQSVLADLPHVIAPVPESVKALPNFSTLFGSESLCSCEHCGSVLSPAAYLVDLLEFLNPKAGAKPIAKLRQKRPDLEHIPLTCENTNQPLPYLDLVNEILEFYVANGALSPNASHNTEGLTAAELSVNPQYLDEKAYQKVADAVYPPSLPFHRPLAVMRLYLEHLGASRAQVMELCRHGGLPSDADIDLEFHRMAPVERAILTGTSGHSLAVFYGYPPAQNPSGLGQVKVSDFLGRLGLTYDELVQLLATTTLNPTGSIILEDDENPPRCDLAKTTLKNLTPGFWGKAHRFVRLRRLVGWSIQELDLTFLAFQEQDLTEGFLRKLSVIQRLKSELKLSVRVLLSLWSPLDSQGTNSLYAQLFLNLAVQNPPSPEFELAKLKQAAALLKDHVPTVLAVLQLTTDEFEVLRRHLGLEAEQTPLTLIHLSALHRYVVFARALKLRIPELVAICILTGEDPFGQADPTATRRFVETVRLIMASGFTVAQLNYLYRHLSDPLAELAPSVPTLLALCSSLRRGLHNILTESSTPADPTIHPLRPGLTAVLGEQWIEPALAVVDGSSLTETERAAFIDEHFALFVDPSLAKSVLLNPAGTLDSRRQFIQAQLTAYQQKGLVVQAVSAAFDIESRVAGLLLETILRSEADPTQPALQDFLRLTTWTDAIPTEPPQGSLLPTPLAEIVRTCLRLHKVALLSRGFDLGVRELTHLSQHGIDFDGFDVRVLPLSESAFQSAQFRAWLRVARACALRTSLPRVEADLFDIFAAAHAPQDQNPRQRAIDQLVRVTGWEAQWLEFLVGPNGFNLSEASDFSNELRLVPVQQCMHLSRRLGIACERLFAWATATPDTGLANDIVSTVKAKYTNEQWLAMAKPMNDTLREQQRQALVTYILGNDPAVKQAGLTTSNQLFEYFLIDVEMGACMKTSRIKQAISSVQLFIQRCLMNLEDGVSPSTIHADQWEWMKYYRVWEANRKVFLYPENWIEPELRDDKTPFFKELENELLQNDLTNETAERAFVHYLDKLDGVARLEVCGLYVQKPQAVDDDEVVHVFGRTKTTPRLYYYRRLVNRRTWTPWEKVELDIQGDHLIPAVQNRRLYLFWLQFEQKQDKNQELSNYIQSAGHYKWLTQDLPNWKAEHDTWAKQHELRAVWNFAKDHGMTIPKDKFMVLFGFDPTIPEEFEPTKPEQPPFSTQPPLTHWEIRLVWSEYKDGQWSAKATSSEYLVSPHVEPTIQATLQQAGWLGQWMLDLFKEQQIVRVDKHGKLVKTVFSVYLPSEAEHFVRVNDGMASGADDLTLTLFRRYDHSENVVGAQPLPVVGYERLGTFTLTCGKKFKATVLSPPTSLDYKSLKRPDGTRNWAMSFQRTTGAHTLAVSAGGHSMDILRTLPDDGEYRVQYEPQHPSFRLTPPFQDFVYQDQPKTYFVSYHEPPPREIVSGSNQAVVSVAIEQEAALVATAKERQLLLQMATASSGSLTASGLLADPVFLADQPSIDSGPPANVNPMSGSRFSVETMAPKQTIEDAYAGRLAPVLSEQEGLRFETFFHPHVCAFIQRLYHGGIPELLSRTTQQLDHDAGPEKNQFVHLYKPSALVARPYPREHVDFEHGAYALYNWELFFHIPLRIAVSLTQNQRFEEALAWYHFVFNPVTDDPSSSRQRYWNTLPLYRNSQPETEQISRLLSALAGQQSDWQEVETQIEEWLRNPFSPHAIARLRLTAYQKHVVMKYIDNLIAWGDQLFSRDTIESINEATLLYVLAANVLGPRPQTVPRHTITAPKTYHDLAGELDAFGNILVEAENIIPYKDTITMMSKHSAGHTGASIDHSKPGSKPIGHGPPPSGAVGQSAVQTLYFCVPKNEELLRYWNTVEDRLFKIRHCQNIEGVTRELPLFEPPIDPALLVKARAAGVDLNSALNDLFAPMPHYRFTVMQQKALELCNELKALGASLLSALEKRDAEALSTLRAAQETAMLKSIRQVKEQQVDEAKANIEGLNCTRDVTEKRYSYYRDIQRISKYEQDHMDGLSNAQSFNLASQSAQATASVAYQFPNATVGVSGPASSPVSTVSFGGTTAGAALQSGATVVSMIAAAYTHDATMASIMGGHERRWDEWKLQETLASKELRQIDKQIAAAKIRQAITERELENHDQQIEHSGAIEEFLRNKYTKEDLYNWMITQVSRVYFQTYKLAYDLAKRAERTYRHELGLQDSGFIQFGYWDSLKKGLLAGEQLSLDLKRMDAAYLERNKREFELTKHVSILQVNPEALLQLRTTGRCTVSLPEELFDMDGPGHYFRRIKSVAVSIPCVAGPYISVNCTLTLLKSSIRKNALLDDGAYTRTGAEDGRFSDNFGSLQSIVTSTAQSDSGLFETNLRDERYLPFENAGAISEWQLELPVDVRQFDYDTISDVILHVRYTAREGGGQLRNGAVANLKARIETAQTVGSVRLFSVRHEFPTEWARFKAVSISGAIATAELALTLRDEHYPFWSIGRLAEITRVEVYARMHTAVDLYDTRDPHDPNAKKDSLANNVPIPGLAGGTLANIAMPAPTGTWSLFFTNNSMEDLWVALTWGS